MKEAIPFLILQIFTISLFAQINTDRVSVIDKNALYFEGYVLSIQYFNQVIKPEPWLAEPYLYRAVTKMNLDDFKGAEEDYTLCLQRNPFLTQAYCVHGTARQSQEKYDETIDGCQRGFEFKPEDRQMLANMAMIFIQKKDYNGVEKTFGDLTTAHPKYSVNYMIRGAMYLGKGDTLKALADYNKMIKMNPYYAPAYGNRAILHYQMDDCKDVLADLNEALCLDARESGCCINRGLVRYQMNDLRGAMADYDQVISIDRRNLIVRFNQGLLRFQVGGNNRTIEDFDVVIRQEPNNYMTYCNHALLRFETGDYRGAVQGYDVVLRQYPTSLPGFVNRSEAKRKLGDNVGTDRDYWTAIKMEEQAKNGQLPKTSSSNSNTAVNGDVRTDDSEENTHERPDRNVNKFNHLVVYDKKQERKSKYQSEVRRRIQNQNVHVDLEPQFVLTYYGKANPVEKSVYYDKMVKDYNGQMVLKHKLRITNKETTLTEDQVAVHFASIDEYSAEIEHDPNSANAYLSRTMDLMLVQDFSGTIKNFLEAIERDPSFTVAYFNHTVERYKQLMYTQSQQASKDTYDLSGSGVNLDVGKSAQSQVNANTSVDLRSAMLKGNKRAYEHEQVMRDYDMVIKLNPGFVYAYLNRTDLHCAQRGFRAAIVDYSGAVEQDPEFAETCCNCGLARLSQGDASRDIADLGRTGELGIYNAYSIIRQIASR